MLQGITGLGVYRFECLRVGAEAATGDPGLIPKPV